MRLLASFLAATSFAVVAADSAPYFEPTVAVKIERVPNTQVYYTVGQSGVPGSDNQGHTSNAGFVITAKGVVVYDGLGTPGLGYRLLQEIRKRTDKPVAIVVAGHYHADHIYGLQAFKEHTKAVIWAHENASEYLEAPNAEQRLEQRRLALSPWVDEKTFIVKPDKTFSGKHTFDMGDTHIDLIAMGPAHAADDTMMVVKEAGVVFSGDIVFSGRLPFLGGDVNTENWIARLAQLQQLKPQPRFLIPGHGQPSAKAQDAIAFTKNYLAYLREKMGAAAQDFIPFDEAYSATDWSRYKNSRTFDASNRSNAYQVYLEMEAAGLK